MTMSRSEALGVLGLEPSANAQDARRAWRGMARRLHPDAPGGGDAGAFARAAEAMRLLTEDAVPGASPAAAPLVLRVSLSDLFSDRPAPLSGLSCSACAAAEAAPCATCGGTGQERVRRGMVTSWRSCPACGGAGRVSPACRVCGSRAALSGDVAIPPGRWDGAAFPLPGGGEARVAVDLPPGAAIAADGTLLLSALVPFDLLCLGGELPPGLLPVPLVERVAIPPGTPAGHALEVPGAGLPVGGGFRGDVRVRVLPEVPAHPDEEERTWLREWSRLRSRRR